MPDYANHMSYTVDLNKPITTTVWHDLFVTTSKKAHRIELQLRRGTENINFDGAVTATQITYSDMVTKDASGSVENGKVVFVFPDSFYQQSGIFCVVVFIGTGEERIPVFCGEGKMILGETDTRYDPDGVVPSLSEVLAQIEAARAAANAANEAAQDAGDAAQAANDAAQAANEAGEKVNQMTASAVELSYDRQPTVETELLNGHYHLTFGIPKGDPYTIKGQAYATLAALQAAVTNPTEGDQYNVGSAPPYNVYRWTGSAWEDQGVLQGVKGDKGDKGDPGAPGQDGAPGKTPIRGIDYFTQADKDEIIDEVIEATAGLTDSNLDLLWENPNSAVAFAAQSITIDTLDTYDIIAIRYRTATVWNTYSPLHLYLTSETSEAGAAVSAVTENIVTRSVTVNRSAKTVTFGNGSKNGDNMAYNDNTFAVPAAVYGVRWGGKKADAEKIEELESTVDALQNELSNKADVIVESASGALVSIADGTERTAVELISHIEPVQDGSGWDAVETTRTGKNLLSRKNIRDLPYTHNGITFSDAGDGKIEVSGTASAAAQLTLVNRGVGTKDFIKAGTYTISGVNNASNVTIYYQFYNSNDDAMGSSFLTAQISSGNPTNTITLDNDCYYGCYIAVGSGRTPTGFVVPQFESGGVATAYEAYESETIATAFPETVYGGSLNWTTGLLTSTLDADGGELAEPKTIQLTPEQLDMLKGVNNVWSSTGDTDLSYVADTKLYIDQKLAAIAAVALNN